MQRGFLLAFAALLSVLVAVPAVGESAAKPRFTLTINGTQRFQWTLTGGRDARGQAGPCAFTGTGLQTITFHTARPTTVLVPPGQKSSAAYGGEAVLNAATRKRLIPLAGQEAREYRVRKAPNLRACPSFDSEYRGYGHDCLGTNRFLPNASVVVLRYNPTLYNPKRLTPQRALVYVPVDVLLFDRTPKQCDLRLFDLRNYLVGELLTAEKYVPLKGGRFERRGTKLVRGTGSLRFCVDPFGSSAFNADLQSCSKPKRAGQLTGEVTAKWTMTFRRAR